MRNPMMRSLICLTCISLFVTTDPQSCPAQTPAWKSTYDRAVELRRSGDKEGADKLQEEVRRRPVVLRVAVNAILAKDEFVRSGGVFSATAEEEAKRILVDVNPKERSILGKMVMQAIPREDFRAMELIESADCKSDQMVIVGSFFVPLLDTQQAELKLMPDRVFQPFTQRDPSGMEASAPAPQSITLLFRPVISPDGKRIRVEFFDHGNPVNVFSPRALASALAWTLPGSPEVALAPPQFDYEDRAVTFANSVDIHNGGYILLARMTAVGEREVTNSLPVLGKVPLLKKLVSSRKMEKVHAHLFLLLRPVIEGPSPRR